MRKLVYAFTAMITLIAAPLTYAAAVQEVTILLESPTFSEFLEVNDIAGGTAAKVVESLNALTGAKGQKINQALSNMLSKVGTDHSKANVEAVAKANLVVNGRVAEWSELKSVNFVEAAANIGKPAQVTCSTELVITGLKNVPQAWKTAAIRVPAGQSHVTAGDCNEGAGVAAMGDGAQDAFTKLRALEPIIEAANPDQSIDEVMLTDLAIVHKMRAIGAFADQVPANYAQLIAAVPVDAAAIQAERPAKDQLSGTVCRLIAN